MKWRTKIIFAGVGKGQLSFVRLKKLGTTINILQILWKNQKVKYYIFWRCLEKYNWFFLLSFFFFNNFQWDFSLRIFTGYWHFVLWTMMVCNLQKNRQYFPFFPPPIFLPHSLAPVFDCCHLQIILLKTNLWIHSHPHVQTFFAVNSTW